MATLTLDQGAGNNWNLPIANESGSLVYTGTEALRSRIWPGGTLPVTATLAPTWVTTNPAVTNVAIAGTLTATLAPGVYEHDASIQDASGWHDYYRGFLQILASVGSTVAPQTYVADSDLLMYASWIDQLRSDSDQAGWLAQCGQATAWLNEILISRWKYISYSPQIGQPGWGAWSMTWGQDPFPSKWLRDELAAGVLMIRPLTVELVAKKAIGLICGSQLGKSGDTSYRTLARAFHREASNIVKTYRAELDLNNDGFADIIINTGASTLR